MPVRKDLVKAYPDGSLRTKEWLAIRNQVLRKAGRRCQECQARDRSGFIVFDDADGPIDRWTLDLFGHRHAPHGARLITIYLSIAHLNHDPSDNRKSNLKALCLRCHLDHDRANHWAVKRQARAIRDLFAM